MSRLRLSFLGTPLIEFEERVIRLETRKSLALLAYVSVSKQEIPREVMMTIFWGEYDQEHAQSNLRRNLSSLNKKLDFDWLATGREAIYLKTSPDLWSDIEEFTYHQDCFRQHTCQHWEACPECIDHLISAVKLYRGDFLSGLNLSDCPEFDDWQLIQRETYRAQYAFCLEKLSSAYAFIADWEKAIQYTRQWVTLDPFNEVAQRALMQRYVQSGNRNAALRHYDELVHLLNAELNQEPEKESIELYQRIKSEELEKDRTGLESQASVDDFNPANRPILKIKTFIPSFSGNRVSRSRLLALLQAGMQFPLTLISAPAGFGKTTLLSEWASGALLPIAWFSIDKGDNDPVHFMTYLVSALESIQPGIGSEVLLMLRSFRPIAIQTVQASLSNRLFATQTPLALVLDDYHVIDSLEIHQMMTYLIEHLPPQVHVILSTRSDPPLPLSRFRARNLMAEIRTRDLRFTPDEALDFLNRVMGLTLSSEDVAILETRTEGWAVGLQLAALSLRGREDTSSFIRAFSGSHHYILDYLVEEVLSRQPDDILQFLLRTSILERLNHSLCDAVTNNLNSREILEILEKKNLFLVPLDNERHWYRYHHLFAELLQVRLQEMWLEDIPELHHRAALWFEGNGFGTEAIQHALAAQDFAHAASMVEQSTETMWSGYEGILVFQWMNSLPDQVVQSRPRLNLCKAWALLHDAHFAEALKYLDQADHLMQENYTDDVSQQYTDETRGMVAALRSNVFANLGDATRALRDANRAIKLLPEDNLLWRGLAYLCLGFAHEVAGNAEKSNWALIEADITAGKSNNMMLSMLAKYVLGDLHLLRGSLRESNEYFKQVVSLARLFKAERLHELGEAEVERAWVLCEWNKLEDAQEQVRHGLETGRLIGSFLIQIMGHLASARIFLAQGKLEMAYDEVKQTRLITETNQISLYARAAEAYEIRLDLLSGNFDRARLWGHKQEGLSSHTNLGVTAFPPHHFESEALTFIRVLFVEGKTADALRVLDNMLVMPESTNKLSRRIEIFILRALILQNLNDLTSAWSSLQTALLLGEPHSFQRIFLDEGRSLKLLFDWGLEHGKLVEERSVAYVENLLHSFAAEQTDKTNIDDKPVRYVSIPLQQALLVEPLTLRELDVLKLMAEGLTNQQIASKMILSLGTVKMHIHHVLGKLDVPTRAKAVIRARELNLIS